MASPFPMLTHSQRWTVVTPMSANRSAAGVTIFEGRIYVSGGHDGLQIFSSVSAGRGQRAAQGGGVCAPSSAVSSFCERQGHPPTPLYGPKIPVHSKLRGQCSHCRVLLDTVFVFVFISVSGIKLTTSSLLLSYIPGHGHCFLKLHFCLFGVFFFSFLILRDSLCNSGWP